MPAPRRLTRGTPLPIILVTGAGGKIACSISLYLGSFDIFASLTLDLFQLAIWLSKAGIPVVNPVAANEPRAPNTGFAIKFLFVETYEAIFLNVGAASDFKELKTLDIVSTNPLPVMCLFCREYP